MLGHLAVGSDTNSLTQSILQFHSNLTLPGINADPKLRANSFTRPSTLRHQLQVSGPPALLTKWPKHCVFPQLPQVQ